MDAARAAVSKITGRTGHTTDVDEVVNPAITRETVKPTRHEELTTAIDKEVHQDHYHTTVQPLQHREVLPEQHSHQMAAMQNREFSHGDHEGVKRNVQAEIGQFRDSSVTHETQHTRSAAATVAGEHVHHHVHETVQPVIHKETIQPEVVHTTVPIHETHHIEAKHHGMSALPMKTLDEFNKSGGIVSGNQRHTHEEYEGAPRPYNTNLQTTADKILGGHHTGHGKHDSGVGHTTGASALGSSGVGHTGSSGLGSSGVGHTTGSSGIGSSGVGHTGSSGLGSSGIGHNTGSSGIGSSGVGHNTSSSGIGSSNTGYNDHSSSTTTGRSGNTGKPSLADKLNPKIDADGDGKAGFMS